MIPTSLNNNYIKQW